MRNALSEHLNMVVSTNIVRCALHEVGLRPTKKQKIPLLMAKNVCCRLEFAQHHQDWTIHDCYGGIFSDETKVNWFKSNGRAWCWMRDGNSQIQSSSYGSHS